MHPGRPGVVLYSFPDAAEQCTAIHMALRSAGYADEIVWLVNEESGREALDRLGLLDEHTTCVPRRSWAGVLAFASRANVIFTHGLFGNPRPPARQNLVNVWHGMPIKAIGAYDAAESGRGRPATHTVATSPMFADIMATAMTVPRDSIQVVGNPRTDLMTGRDRRDDLQALGIDPDRYRSIVAYLPTYRVSSRQPGRIDGGESGDVTLLAPEHLHRLNTFLEERETLLVAKPHPAAPTPPADATVGNVRVIGDGDLQAASLGLYGFLGHVDALVTDVSSVMLDYLLLDRPVVLFFPDLVSYGDSRTFILEPFEKWAPGPVTQTLDDFLQAMDAVLAGDDPARSIRHRIAEDVNTVPLGGAARRLLEAVGILEPEA